MPRRPHIDSCTGVWRCWQIYSDLYLTIICYSLVTNGSPWQMHVDYCNHRLYVNLLVKKYDNWYWNCTLDSVHCKPGETILSAYQYYLNDTNNLLYNHYLFHNDDQDIDHVVMHILRTKLNTLISRMTNIRQTIELISRLMKIFQDRMDK